MHQPADQPVSLARRLLTASLWLPYTFALCFIWGFIFDFKSGRWRDPVVHRTLSGWIADNREAFVLAGLTIVVPFFACSLARFLFVAFTNGGRLRRLADRCPQCDYTLPAMGEHTCPECGVRSAYADRTAVTPAGRALRDLPWLRRFTLACIVGFVGGPVLAMLETALVRHFAERAFALPPPTSVSVPKVTAKDYVPGWVDAEYLYSDEPGGRLYWSPGYWKHVDYYANRQPQIFRPSFRIVPWFVMGEKLAQPGGRVFVDFD